MDRDVPVSMLCPCDSVSVVEQHLMQTTVVFYTETAENMLMRALHYINEFQPIYNMHDTYRSSGAERKSHMLANYIGFCIMKQEMLTVFKKSLEWRRRLLRCLVSILLTV